MNKPAPKEPSMDEILSSIRQIIADDDAGLAPRKPVLATAPVKAPPPPEPDPEPLALSAEQILRDAAAHDSAGPGMSFDEILGQGGLGMSSGPMALVDPEDIAFDIEDEAPPAPAYTPPPERPVQRAAPVAHAAPMPDPTLSQHMAEQLLGPTTEAAVKTTFARLSNMSTIPAGLTIEQLMRDMLRPMLKDWLDENLPAMVERIVAEEIARAARGRR